MTLNPLIGTIVVPGRTPSQNEMRSLGVWAERKAKKRWRDDACLLALEAIPAVDRWIGEYKKPNLPEVKRKLVITSFRIKLLDNASESLAGGACKHIVDGLKLGRGTKQDPFGAGVIVDDSEKWCEREYRQVLVKDRKEERLEIEVWRL